MTLHLSWKPIIMCQIRKVSLVQKGVALPVSCHSTGVTNEDSQLARARPFHEMPGPSGLPYIGSLLDYRIGRFNDVSKYHLALTDRHARYGNIFRQTIAGITTVHLSDPGYVRALYQHEGKQPFVFPFMPMLQLYRELRKRSPGLGNINGDEWYRLRGAVQGAMMKPKEVAAYLPSVSEIAEDYVSRFADLRDANDEIPNLESLTLRWSLESAGMTCFGFRCGYLSQENEDEALRMIQENLKLFQISNKLKFSLPFYKLMTTPTWRKITKSEDYFLGNAVKYVTRAVAGIQKETDLGIEDDSTFMFQKALLSRPELNFEDISMICVSMLIDGLQATVPSLFYTLYMLATHPEVQDKVVQEIWRVVPLDGDITPSVLGELSYTKACYKETFRFFPSAVEISRLLTNDIVLGGYRIPKGTSLEMNNFILFKDPKYFQEPEVFKPERWLRNSQEKIDPVVLLPFGRGPRMCPARRFVEQEIYVLLVKILQRYRVEWNHPPMGQKFQMLMVPDCPPKFSFKSRDNRTRA